VPEILVLCAFVSLCENPERSRRITQKHKGCLLIRHRDSKNKLTGDIEVQLINEDSPTRYNAEVIDNAYKTGTRTKIVNNSGSSGSHASIVMDLSKSFGWYDFSVRITGNTIFEKRYAGRVEIGKSSVSDPAMAG